MSVLDTHFESPAAGWLPAGGREFLPAESPSAARWPGGQAQRTPEPVWRPAPFAEELHVLASEPQMRFAGEPIAETACANTAYVNAHVRNGAETWRGWPRCPECARRVGAP